jgi:hypothetical protein
VAAAAAIGRAYLADDYERSTERSTDCGSSSVKYGLRHKTPARSDAGWALQRVKAREATLTRDQLIAIVALPPRADQHFLLLQGFRELVGRNVAHGISGAGLLTFLVAPPKRER